MSTCQDEDNIFLNCQDEENIFRNFLSVGLLSHCSIQCDCRPPIVWSLERERPQHIYSTRKDWELSSTYWRWLVIKVCWLEMTCSASWYFSAPSLDKHPEWVAGWRLLLLSDPQFILWALCNSWSLHQLSLTNFIRTSIKRKRRQKEFQDIT